MIERGVGSMGWVNNYIGIPYEVGGRAVYGVDCFGLVKMVYQDILQTTLPDWITDDEIDWDVKAGSWDVVDDPFDFCILHTRRVGAMPDHFGLFIGGGVLSAESPKSSFTPLDKYLGHYPDTVFGVYQPEGFKL